MPGVFKLSCSTPFSHLLRLVFVYQPVHLDFIQKLSPRCLCFQLPSGSRLLSITNHSPVFICITALLHVVLLPLFAVTFRPSVFAVRCIPCRGRMGSCWLRSPVGSNTLLRPGLPLDGWLRWPDPINRLVVVCPNFD